MSEQPPIHAPSAKGLAKRKILGVPVLYLLGGFVLILAVYAYKTKKSAAVMDGAAVAEPDTSTALPALSDGTVYPAMPSDSVTGTPPTATLPNTAIDTNDEWVKAGVAFLVGTGVSGGAAQGVLQKYLEGSQLTYSEGVMRDTVIRQFGLPPTLLPTGGTSARPVPPSPTPTPPRPVPTRPSTKTNLPGFATGYYRRPGDPRTWFMDPHGNLHYVSTVTYRSRGNPYFRTLPASSLIWKHPYSAGI